MYEKKYYTPHYVYKAFDSQKLGEFDQVYSVRRE
jgi:hypothetical protein